MAERFVTRLGSSNTQQTKLFQNVTYIVNWIIKKPLCEPEVQDVRNFSTKTYNQRPKQYRQAYETIFLEEHKTGRF